MATVTRSPLAEQAEKLHQASRLLGDGRLLAVPLKLAQSGSVFGGPIQDAFLGWLQHALDLFVRNQLAQGVRLLAENLSARVADIERAQQAMAAGQIGVVGPQAPTPLNWSPGIPPPYGQIGSADPANPQMNADGLRKLSKELGRTADEEVMKFARDMEKLLQPPPQPPPTPGAPPPISPLPPDAAQAVGYPDIYLAIANHLRSAAGDLAQRADLLDLANEPLEGTATIDLEFIDKVEKGADAVAEDAAESGAAAGDVGDTSTQPAPVGPIADDRPPPPPEDHQIAEADALIDRFPPEDVMDEPRKLQELSRELDKHDGHEAFAARFIDRFGHKNLLDVPRVLQAWEHQHRKGLHHGPEPQKSLPFEAVEDRPKDGEIEGILYSFCATLATATTDDNLTEDERKELDDVVRGDGDPLALSWLLTDNKHEYDAEFLVKAFGHVEFQILKMPDGWEGDRYAGSPITGRDGEPLNPDPKVAILNCLSRNDKAAAILSQRTYDEVYRLVPGVGQVEVTNITTMLYSAKWGDDGAAAGRFFEAAHRGLANGEDPARAKAFVDQLVGDANESKELKNAVESLRRIGQQAETTDADAEAARQKVEKDSKHPARELLLARCAQRLEVAGKFAADAAGGKKYTERSLYETRSGWDVVKAVHNSAEASEKQRLDAENVLDRALRDIADGQKLNDAARRGIAEVAALHLDELTLILSTTDPSAEQLEAAGIGATPQQVRDALRQIVKDKEALGTLITAASGKLAAHYAAITDRFASILPTRPPGLSDIEWTERVSDTMQTTADAVVVDAAATGRMFCELANSVRLAGIDKREAAAALLANYRLGVDIAFGLLEKIPGVGQATDAVNTVTSYIPNTDVQGFQDSVKGGVASALSGIDMGSITADTKAQSEQARQTLDQMTKENIMASMAKNPVLVANMRVTFPKEMLVEPGSPVPPLVPDPTRPPDGLRIPNGYLKPQYYDAASGGVRLPLPGSEDYEPFRDWTVKNHPFSVAATHASESIREEMGNCMVEKLWGIAS